MDAEEAKQLADEVNHNKNQKIRVLDRVREEAEKGKYFVVINEVLHGLTIHSLEDMGYKVSPPKHCSVIVAWNTIQ